MRPHQKQAVHCFLVQVGALALSAAGEAELPTSANRWSALLRGLTPGFNHDEPWCLIVDDLSKPAFLQPPVPEGTINALPERETTPDGLDMLVTSKNHDLKAGRMTGATLERWVYALITLQTCEGFLGRGNYGISRMNGGFASRPFVGAAPVEGGWAAHIRRDIVQLLARRAEMVEANPAYAETGGLGLVWLSPWDGAHPLKPQQLDPYYVEICRRIRLQRDGAGVVARRGSSSAARIAFPDDLTGMTGDPWTPTDRSAARPKPLTLDATGFTYRRVVSLLDAAKFEAGTLQRIDTTEQVGPMQLVFVATVRGQGETQGYHERRIIVPPRAVPMFLRKASGDRLAPLAKQRVEDVAKVQNKALKPALLTLFQSAPDKLDFKDPKASAKADLFLTTFDHAVDEAFFAYLFTELEHDAHSPAATAARRTWVEFLRKTARDTLATAEAGSPLSHVRRYRARAAAERALEGAIRNLFKDIFDEAA
jgi:CRISPR system Cascade subunit CasA